MKPFTDTKFSWLPLLLAVALVVASLVNSTQETDQDDDNDADDDADDENDDDDRQPLLGGGGGGGGSSRQSLHPKLGWQDCGRAPARKMKRKRGSSRVIGGRDSYLGEFPSYVLLTTYRVKQPYIVDICGGTLLSDQHVLTAAHCISGNSSDNRRVVNVIVGDITTRDHYDEKFKYKVVGDSRMCNSVKHDPRRPAQSGHDWVVLELENRVVFNDYTQPACLPRNSTAVKTRSRAANCYLVGLGIVNFTNVDNDDSTGKAILPKILQKVKVQQVDCNPPLGDFSNNDPSRSCYVRAGKQAGASGCEGDSGGPVICMDDSGRQTVTAIHSATVGRFCSLDKEYDGQTIPNVYTDVKKVLPDMDTFCQAKDMPSKAPRVRRPPPFVSPPRTELRASNLD